jgi:transposase-like protein
VTQYSEEFKASIIAKMLAPNSVSVPDLVRETGIPKDTLYTWRIKHLKSKGHATVQPAPSGGLSSEGKFTAVMETASLNEVELSEYCRRRGLYPAQLSTWREACVQANASATAKVDREKLRQQAKDIKQLEAELRRKEKALAEAAALLMLQKKVQALWGEPEGGKSSSGSAGK